MWFKALKIEVGTNIIHLLESADFEEGSGAVIGQTEQCIISLRLDQAYGSMMLKGVGGTKILL